MLNKTQRVFAVRSPRVSSASTLNLLADLAARGLRFNRSTWTPPSSAASGSSQRLATIFWLSFSFLVWDSYCGYWMRLPSLTPLSSPVQQKTETTSCYRETCCESLFWLEASWCRRCWVSSEGTSELASQSRRNSQLRVLPSRIELLQADQIPGWVFEEKKLWLALAKLLPTNLRSISYSISCTSVWFDRPSGTRCRS